MKRIISIFILISMTFVMVGCVPLEERPKYYFKENGISYWKLNDKQCAIGKIAGVQNNDVVFIPTTANGYEVVQLGWELGYYDTYNVISSVRLPYLRLYIPGSIMSFYSRYFHCFYKAEIFYCGKVQDIYHLLYDASTVYVPSSDYEAYKSNSDEIFHKRLFAANISYSLNFKEGNDYYYIDNEEYGQRIEHVPPTPKRDGYTFNGWYTESECMNKWNFEEDCLPVLSDNETFKETKLYAKWTEITTDTEINN